jgi:glyoxylase I family protein
MGRTYERAIERVKVAPPPVPSAGDADMAQRESMAVPFVVEELDHVVLRCREQARMLDFYVRVLGLVEERRLEGIGLIQLRAGRSLVDLVPDDGAGARERSNVDHVCLAVTAPDMEAVAAHLASAGVETIGDPMVRYGARGYGLSIYCRDPEGNVIELKSSTAAPVPGRREP